MFQAEVIHKYKDLKLNRSLQVGEVIGVNKLRLEKLVGLKLVKDITPVVEVKKSRKAKK